MIGAAEKANLREWRSTVSRSALDYRWTKRGTVQARLTMTFPGGTVFRFKAEADPRVIMAVLREQNPEVGFSLKGILKGVKKIAKKVASSKVFRLAAKALAAVAPMLGPIAPALLAGSAAMGVTTKLLAAKHHAAKGNKAAAAKLVASAAQDAKALPEGAPVTSAHVLDAANAHSNKVYTLLLRPA